jgi:hypothetical protein
MRRPHHKRIIGVAFGGGVADKTVGTGDRAGAEKDACWYGDGADCRDAVLPGLGGADVQPLHTVAEGEDTPPAPQRQQGGSSDGRRASAPAGRHSTGAYRHFGRCPHFSWMVRTAPATGPRYRIAWALRLHVGRFIFQRAIVRCRRLKRLSATASQKVL